MQYYRLWIYSCNVVLGLTSAIFIIFAAFVVADVRLSLLEGVELYHPTFFYAYGALILQCGVVQTIGCLGAKRLSHKLLSLYWTLLLLLTLGDIGVGLYWVFHLEKVKINLRPYLAKEFIEKYSTDESFTLTWNKILSQDRCCGVDGPFDFEKFSTSHHSKQAAFSANPHLIVDVETGLLSLPESCCTLIYVPTTISSSSSSGTSLDKTYRVSRYPSEEEQALFSQQSADSSSSPDVDHSTGFAGGGRRSRTVISFPHKNDEPHRELLDNGEAMYDPDVEAEFFVDHEDSLYHINSSEGDGQFIVPDDLENNHHHHDKIQPPATKSVLSPVFLKRDINTFEPNHVHKVRHELHRKSQSSHLIDLQLPQNPKVVLANGSNVLGAERVGRSIDQTAKSNYNTSRVGLEKDKFAVPQALHQLQSHNKSSKSLPSISARPGKRRKRREWRALSATQVPAVTAPFQRRICGEQPEGLNHHNSYKKDLLDQRKTTKSEQGAKTFQVRKPGASWPYPKITRTTVLTTPTSAPITALPPQIQTKFTLTENTDKVKVNEIERLTKRQEEKTLLATRVSRRIMLSSADASLHSSNSNSFSSPEKGSKAKDERNEQRRKRNADTSEDNSDSTLQLDPFAISQSSAFTSKEAVERRKGTDSSAESYFFPLSSSSGGVSSSTLSLAEASSPQTAAYAPLASLSHDQWNANNDSGRSNNNDGNSSSASGIQKRLYVYGQGCGVKLIEWVDHVSGIMFILGFCIVGFAKTCFLVILRTEIREMIEKIHMIEPEEALSPTRTHCKDQRFSYVSHPLLQNPHRASTVSAHGVLLPTIKSPDGPTTTSAPSGGIGGYNRPNRHYLRRASNIVGGDRSRSHSNETVNMTLLMTTSASSQVGDKRRSNPNLSHGGGSMGTIGAHEERDAVSGLNVPSTNMTSHTPNRYLRRSSTCSSSANPAGYGYGLDVEPRAGPSSRFYQYFDPIYQTPPHLYQQHHHHHYTRRASHARNMSCGAILPLTSYRTNSAAAAAAAAALHRGNRGNLLNAAPSSGGCSFSSKEENEMLISVSLEHIASSDQDEEVVAEENEDVVAEENEEDENEQKKKDWAAATACVDTADQGKSGTLAKVDDTVGTKLQTFTHSESANENPGSMGSSGEQSQRRNGNNNVDLTNSLPMSYIGTAV